MPGKTQLKRLNRTFNITMQGNIQIPKGKFKQVPGEDPSLYWEFQLREEERGGGD